MHASAALQSAFAAQIASAFLPQVSSFVSRQVLHAAVGSFWLSAGAQTGSAPAVGHAVAAQRQPKYSTSAASKAVGVFARQQSPHSFAVAFCPHAALSESGVDGSGVLLSVSAAVVSLPAFFGGVFVSPDDLSAPVSG